MYKTITQFIQSGPYENKPKEKSTTKTLSRQQRKRRKGKERIRKRREFEKNVIENIEKKKSMALNGLFHDIKGLATSLPSSAGSNEKKKVKSMTNKQRHRVTPSELSVMKNVIKHPTFTANPLGALKQHLLAVASTKQT